MISSFKGNYRFLSNFSKHGFLVGNIYWPTVEHFYQACKTKDRNTRNYIRKLKSPSEAKRIGRKVKLRKDWDDIKLDVMKYAVEQKFNSNPDIKQLLLETQNEKLVEGNTWHDNFWGTCFCKDCRSIVGDNHLGKILMELRKKWNQ